MRKGLAFAAVGLLAIAAPAAARDWTRSVTQLPNGAYLLGNPKAPVKLVEYLSLTCSHCAAFANEGWPALRNTYVGSGRVSLEVRHALRDGYDLAASLLVRCEGPKRYFAATDAYFARQREWLAMASAAQIDAAGLKPEEATVTFAKAGGLDTIAQARGLPPARIAACLTDSADRTKLTAMADEAWKQRQIGGTPAFLINGRAVGDAHGWAALEPQIVAALK